MEKIGRNMKSENSSLLKLFKNEPAPEGFKKDLEMFLENSDEIIGIVLDNVKLDINIDLVDDIAELAEKYSLDETIIKKIIGISSFIFCRLEENKLSLDDLHNDFLALKSTDENYEKLKDIYGKVGKSFANRYLIYMNIKKKVYSILPRYMKIKRNVNLRIINGEKGNEILDLIPIAQIEMEFGELGGYNFKNQKIKFQATLKDIDEIIEELNKIKLDIVSISEYNISK